MTGVGVLLGTYFSVAELAALSFVAGVAPLAKRASYVFIALTAALLALVVNMAVAGDLRKQSFIVLGILAAGSMILVFFIGAPLWLVLRRRGIRLCHVTKLPPATESADQQFGIRDMLVVTTTIAILIATLRWMMEAHLFITSDVVNPIVFIGALVAFNVLAVLPLLVSVLLRRFALISTLASLGLMAAATVGEIEVLGKLSESAGKQPLVVWSLNGTQVAWALIVLGTLRAGGYRLASPERSSSPPLQA
jgi:hypothetical protein